MSLLMEALRKAEEAKRLAAHNTTDDSSTEGQRPSLNLVADDKLAKFADGADNQKTTDQTVESGLDIPLDFRVEKPNEANINSPIEKDAKFELSLDESYIDSSLQTSDTHSDNFATEPLVSKSEPASIPDSTTMHLVVEDDTDAPTSAVDSINSADNDASEKQAEESRRRESARAVFRAKSKPSRNKQPFFIAVAILTLFPLVGGAYLLLNEFGILGRGVQYNIPVSTVLVDRTFDEFAEEVALEPLQTVQPDVSSSDVIVLIGEQSIEDAIESVVTAISPQLPSTTIPEVYLQVPVSSIETPAIVEAATEVLRTDPVAQDTAVAIAGEPTGNAAEPALEALAPKPISVVRSESPAQLNPLLLQAFDAFNANDYIAARALYQQTLREIPNSRDAMLGMAAVGLRVGDTVTARETYLRLLQLNPRDVLARVGLLETIPARDPVAQESELKSLFEANPDVPHLAFSLGNLYASQRRWNEAQQSYYDALLSAKSSDDGAISPDFAFNLAISLERLNQVASAANFYREALEQSRVVNPSFDLQILRERLDAIERLTP